MERDLRTVGQMSLRGQVGTEVGTEIVDRINEEVELAGFHTEEIRDIKKEARRQVLRKFMTEPTAMNYVNYWLPTLDVDSVSPIAAITMPKYDSDPHILMWSGVWVRNSHI